MRKEKIMKEEFSIEDLAKRSGVSVRTVRYYMQQGLVPSPDTSGKYASYSQDHLDHLLMVQRLKRLHLPLKEIRHLIASISREDMSQMLGLQDEMVFNKSLSLSKDGEVRKNREISSAKEYIEGLAKHQQQVKRIAEEPRSYTQPGLRNLQVPERWSKIRLAEGVELNVREQEERALRKEILMLIESAKQIFSKGR